MSEQTTAGLRVLWATDGSSSSRAAVPVLRQLILPSATSLTVLSVAPHALLSGARPEPTFLARVTPGARQDALREAENTAREMATLLDPTAPVQAISRWGNPIEEILREAASADITVLGAKGHSNLGLILLGSVSQAVVQHATEPVLIARPHSESVSRVVVGYDGSPAARKSIEFLERLRLPETIEFHLVWVIEPFSVPARMPIGYREQALSEAHQINQQRHAEAESELAELEQSFLSAGRRATHSVLAGPAGPELDDYARKHEAGLVVVGSRKPSAARHYLLGSTAEKLVRHSHTSVLVVR